MPADLSSWFAAWRYPADWRDQAACAGEALEVFIAASVKTEVVSDRARQLCAGCPVAGPCLEEALKTDAVGTWGGTSRPERVKIRSERRRQARRDRQAAAAQAGPQPASIFPGRGSPVDFSARAR